MVGSNEDLESRVSALEAKARYRVKWQENQTDSGISLQTPVERQGDLVSATPLPAQGPQGQSGLSLVYVVKTDDGAVKVLSGTEVEIIN